VGPVGAIILAAGESRRFGHPKLAAAYQGVPLLRRAVDAAVSGGCGDVVVVLGADADIYRPLLAGTPARAVLNPEYGHGMSTSIRAGLAHLSPECEAALILLADQPGVDADVVRRLLDAYQSSGRRIVAARYGEVRGAPVLFDRALFLQLLVLEGDRGARTVMEAFPQEVAEVVISPVAGADVDRPEDLEGPGRDPAAEPEG
jgi:molybdenum cofactor cytidylyltransferase